MRLLTFQPWLNLQPRSVMSILQQNGNRQNDLLISRDNPKGDEHAGSYWNIQTQYEKMRNLVLEKYDKVWVVEADMIVPDDALEKLCEVDAPVVSGIYLLRHNSYRPNTFGERGKYPIMEVGGAAMGCLLIDRSVLEGFSFLLSECKAPDGEFMRYCREKGFRQMARFDVPCGHITATGEVLWPNSQT